MKFRCAITRFSACLSIPVPLSRGHQLCDNTEVPNIASSFVLFSCNCNDVFSCVVKLKSLFFNLNTTRCFRTRPLRWCALVFIPAANTTLQQCKLKKKNRSQKLATCYSGLTCGPHCSVRVYRCCVQYMLNRNHRLTQLYAY
jgi:hypothetical protein